jgi:hypothetical protein
MRPLIATRKPWLRDRSIKQSSGFFRTNGRWHVPCYFYPNEDDHLRDLSPVGETDTAPSNPPHLARHLTLTGELHFAAQVHRYCLSF